MTLDQIIPIAIQLPVVILFIWYSDRLFNQFMSFLREERAARQQNTDALVKEMQANAVIINDFRAEVNSAIQVMKDRTESNRSDTSPLKPPRTGAK